MADVAQKAINANDVINGAVVVKSAGAPTRFQTIDPEVNPVQSAADMEARLTGRMDDPRYYSGDTAS